MQCTLAGEELQQDGPFATQRRHLRKMTWGRFIFKQSALLDVVAGYATHFGSRLFSRVAPLCSSFKEEKDEGHLMVPACLRRGAGLASARLAQRPTNDRALSLVGRCSSFRGVVAVGPEPRSVAHR